MARQLVKDPSGYWDMLCGLVKGRKGGAGSGSWNGPGDPRFATSRSGDEPNELYSQTREGPIATFSAAVKEAAQKEGFLVKVGKTRPTSGGWSTTTIDVQTKGGGFAQAVLWSKRSGTEYLTKLQQHDISIPESTRGGGVGGKLIDALVAGYKALGVEQVPIHLNTNPGFWDSMRQRHPKMFKEE